MTPAARLVRIRALRGRLALLQAQSDKPPKLFTDFVAWLKVALTPAQFVIGRVAFDGVDPQDLPEAQRELARDIFGPIDAITENARRVFVAVCGARGGKTYTLCALRLLHLALTVSLATLAPGEVASAPITAPDKELARQALGYIRGAIAAHPSLAPMLTGPGNIDSFDIDRGDGVVEFVCRAASVKGKTGRGRSLVGAVLDEAAFFMDATYKVNDEEVFKALRPRVLTGGQLVVSSTTWAQTGLLHRLFSENHPDPSVAGLATAPQLCGSALAAHAPTLTLRDTPELRAIVEDEYRTDPDNAAREYGARFMGTSSATFFDPASIVAAIRETPMPIKPRPGDEVSTGADYGFARNSSAFAAVHRSQGRIRTAELLERKAEEGKPLKPSVVIREFCARTAWHGCSFTIADGHYRETVDEYMGEAEQSFLPAPLQSDLPFVRARAALREGIVDLPNHPRFLKQLREVMSRPLSGGRVSIILPKWRTGEHGDLVAAWVLAVYQLVGDVVVDSEKPAPGSPEALRVEAERMLDEHIAEHEAKRSTESEWWG